MEARRGCAALGLLCGPCCGGAGSEAGMLRVPSSVSAAILLIVPDPKLSCCKCYFSGVTNSKIRIALGDVLKAEKLGCRDNHECGRQEAHASMQGPERSERPRCTEGPSRAERKLALHSGEGLGREARRV